MKHSASSAKIGTENPLLQMRVPTHVKALHSELIRLKRADGKESVWRWYEGVVTKEVERLREKLIEEAQVKRIMEKHWP